MHDNCSPVTVLAYGLPDVGAGKIFAPGGMGQPGGITGIEKLDIGQLLDLDLASQLVGPWDEAGE